MKIILCTLIQIVNVIYRSRNNIYFNLTMYIAHYICVHMPKGGTSWQSIYTTQRWDILVVHLSSSHDKTMIKCCIILIAK